MISLGACLLVVFLDIKEVEQHSIFALGAFWINVWQHNIHEASRTTYEKHDPSDEWIEADDDDDVGNFGDRSADDDEIVAALGGDKISLNSKVGLLSLLLISLPNPDPKINLNKVRGERNKEAAANCSDYIEWIWRDRNRNERDEKQCRGSCMIDWI